METGYIVRYDRGEGYEPIDIGELTSAEFGKFMKENRVSEVTGNAAIGVPIGEAWAIALHKWIIGNVEEVKGEG